MPNPFKRVLSSVSLVAAILLGAAPAATGEPIFVGEGLWQDGNFSNLFNIEQVVNAGGMSIEFDYDWGAHEIDDRHETIFGFPDATLVLSRGLRSWVPEEGLTAFALGLSLFPPGTDVILRGPDAAPSVAFDRALALQTYLPGDVFTLTASSLRTLGDQTWLGEIHFSGTVNADSSGGVGHGSIVVSRVPEPSTILMLSMGTLGAAAWRRRGSAGRRR